MTQKSYFWDQDAVGHGQATYSDDEFSTILGLLFTYDRSVCYIAQTRESPYITRLLPQAAAGNFTVEPGVALVDGRIYENDATITLVPADGDGYYAIVLRKTEAAQTVRAALIYNAVAYPTPTQGAAVWEVVVGRGQVIAGAAQIDYDDRYIMPLALNALWRVGDMFIWAEADQENWPIAKGAFQCGVVAGGATVSVTFPRPYYKFSPPLVFVTPVNLTGGTPSHTYVIYISSLTNLGFTIKVDSATNITSFYWIAFGAEDEVGL